MTYQRVLLKLLSSGCLGATGKRYMKRRRWTISKGEGAGLKLCFPQNREFLNGMYETPVQEALARYLRAGDVFYDIGANIGFFSLIAGRLVGPKGRVVAFEPVARNAAAIARNFCSNRMDKARLFEVAVGAHSGSAELVLTGWDGGNTLSSSPVVPSDPVSQKIVRLVALDDFIPLENLDMPNFVKIDVEGVELDVIQGMVKTIANARPTVLYEMDDGDKDSFERRWSELDEYMKTLDYRIARLADSYSNSTWNVGHSLALPKE